MQTEMPKKYWKNLPEAEIIEELINGSGGQVQAMMDEQQRPLKPEPRNAYLKHLSKMSEMEELGERVNEDDWSQE